MSTNVNIGFGSSGLVERIKGQQRNARTDRMLRERLLTDATKAAIAKLTAPGIAPIDTYTDPSYRDHLSAGRIPNTAFLIVGTVDDQPDDNYNVSVETSSGQTYALDGTMILHTPGVSFQVPVVYTYLARGISWDRHSNSIPFTSGLCVSDFNLAPLGGYFVLPPYSLGLFRPREKEVTRLTFTNVLEWNVAPPASYNYGMFAAGFVGNPKYYLGFYKGNRGADITIPGVEWGATNPAMLGLGLYPPGYVP